MEWDVPNSLVHAKEQGHFVFVAVDTLLLVDGDILALVSLQKLGQEPQESAVLALPLVVGWHGQFDDRGGQQVRLAHRTLLLSTHPIHYTEPDWSMRRSYDQSV